MADNTAAYQETLNRLQQSKQFLRAQRRKLKSAKLTCEEIERAMGPARCFHAQLKEEVQSYERAKKDMVWPGDMGDRSDGLSINCPSILTLKGA
jgi:hypothetical protein